MGVETRERSGGATEDGWDITGSWDADTDWPDIDVGWLDIDIDGVMIVDDCCVASIPRVVVHDDIPCTSGVTLTVRPLASGDASFPARTRYPTGG